MRGSGSSASYWRRRGCRTGPQAESGLYAGKSDSAGGERGASGACQQRFHGPDLGWPARAMHTVAPPTAGPACPAVSRSRAFWRRESGETPRPTRAATGVILCGAYARQWRLDSKGAVSCAAISHVGRCWQYGRRLSCTFRVLRARSTDVPRVDDGQQAPMMRRNRHTTKT